MRTALIAAHKRTDADELRAELTLGGRSVLEWQAQLALDLGCERIICLCERTGGVVLNLQSWVEDQGRAFHAVRGNLQLVGLIRAEDELLMLADGLIPDAELVEGFTSGGQKRGIATLPADHPLPQQNSEDFERIDRDRHWAGLAVTSARQVHKLADLPPDHDAISLLLRLALQAGEPCRELGVTHSDSEKWQIATASNEVAKRELAMMDAALPKASWAAPGTALASLGIKTLGAKYLKEGPEIAFGLSGVLAAGGVALAGFGFATSSLVVGAMAAFSAGLGTAWASMRSRLWSNRTNGKRAVVVRFVVEATLTALLAILVFNVSGLSAELALPILAMGVSYLASIGENSALRAFWADRPLHMLALAVATNFDVLPEALGLFAIGALVILLLRKNKT